MKPVLPRIVFLSFAFVLLIAHLAFAETKTFIKEYTYQASEDDSRNSSRVIALREVKRLLLEELGTYLESETEVKNFQITKDQITTLTAGIVQTEIVAEKWDGRIYWLKSKMTADSNEVVQSINELRKDREKTKELESIREKSDDLLKEVKRLRKELASAKDGSRETKKVAYDQSIKELSAAEWIEKGQAVQGRNDNFQGAIDAFSHAIELDQKNIMAYYFRARISEKNSAISDYYRILSIEPKTSEDYLIRAWTYKELNNVDLALKEFGKAIEMASRIKDKAEAYSDRGRYYQAVQRNNNLAIQDFSKAIELNPKDAENYTLRGLSYAKMDKDDLAVADFSKAIELEPNNATFYATRGSLLMFYKPEFAIADFTKAIELNPDSRFTDSDYEHRAYTYEKLGKYDLAIQDWNILIKRGKEDSFCYDQRANLYGLVGEYDLAIRDYNKSIKLDSQNIVAYYGRAKVYALKRNVPMAIEDLKKTIQLSPSFKDSARKESAFNNIRNHPDFIRLIGP